MTFMSSTRKMVTPCGSSRVLQKLLPLDVDAFPWEPRPGENGPLSSDGAVCALG